MVSIFTEENMKLIICNFLIFIYFSANALEVVTTSPVYSEIANNIQGISNHRRYWFISNQWKIFQIGKSVELKSKNFYPPMLKNYRAISIPESLKVQGYNHFGGITVYKNNLVVALERVKPMKLLFFDVDSLDLVKIYDVPSRMDSLSWVAASEGKIYFSENKITKKRPLYVLDPSNWKLKEIYLNQKLARIQGGTYSKRYQGLYLSSDAGASDGGVYFLDLLNLNIKQEVGVFYNRGFPTYGELEGLTLDIDLKNERVTLLYLDNNFIEHSFQFIHISNFKNDKIKRLTIDKDF